MSRVSHTCVTSSYENPRSFVWRDFITSGHREIDIVSEIGQVIDSLLDCMKPQAFHSEIRTWIAETVESVFEYNCSSILLLC